MSINTGCFPTTTGCFNLAQFALYRNTNKRTSKAYPYVLDVQSDLTEVLDTRIVIPLIPARALDKSSPDKLCPVLHIEEGEFAVMTHLMTSIPLAALKNPITTLETFREEVIGAIDLLITGI